MQIVWLFTGAISLILAVLGVVVPILPTTPFVLLAGFCYARSCSRAEYWLRQCRWTKETLDDYRLKRGMPRWRKVRIMLFLYLGLAVSYRMASYAWPLFALVAIGVTWHISAMPTRVQAVE